MGKVNIGLCKEHHLQVLVARLVVFFLIICEKQTGSSSQMREGVAAKAGLLAGSC